MFAWLKRLFETKPSENPILDSLVKGFCPDCQNETFDYGPKGGICQNIRCSACHSKFNVAPFDDGWCGHPLYAERIEA